MPFSIALTIIHLSFFFLLLLQFLSGVAAKAMPVKAEAKAPVVSASGKQDFLEANPYYDQSTIPLQTFKAAAPHIGKVVSVKRIVGPKRRR